MLSHSLAFPSSTLVLAIIQLANGLSGLLLWFLRQSHKTQAVFELAIQPRMALKYTDLPASSKVLGITVISHFSPPRYYFK